LDLIYHHPGDFSITNGKNKKALCTKHRLIFEYYSNSENERAFTFIIVTFFIFRKNFFSPLTNAESHAILEWLCSRHEPWLEQSL
jgi:hypothetical protein